MEIREIRDDEQEAAFYVGSQAFMQGSRDMGWMNDPNRLPRVSYGVWDEAGLQARVSIVQYRVHFGPEILLPMGGVAGVACLPASRGKGYAGACMRFSLERMRDAGQVVSTLHPFSWDYYRRLGYEWIGMQRRYSVPTRILRPDAETEKVRAAVPEDRPRLIAAYTEFAGRYRGMIARDEKNWNQFLDSSDKQFRFTYLYEHEGRVEGYLTYIGGKREETYVREFIALTPRALRGLLGLLRRHEMQVDKFVWETPGNDLLWSLLYHWDIETKLTPVLMGRVVDVPGAIKALKPPPQTNGSLILSIADECAPWNHGNWCVEFADGKVTAAATLADPQIAMDIQALSQAYFGTPTVSELRAADRLIVRDEAAYHSLATLFDGPPMWMNDHF